MKKKLGVLPINAVEGELAECRCPQCTVFDCEFLEKETGKWFKPKNLSENQKTHKMNKYMRIVKKDSTGLYVNCGGTRLRAPKKTSAIEGVVYEVAPMKYAGWWRWEKVRISIERKKEIWRGAK